MWNYNYSGDDNDWLEHASHKYISKKMVNGKWRYTYAKDLKRGLNDVANGVAGGVEGFRTSLAVRDTANRAVGRNSTLKTVRNSIRDGYKVGKATYKISKASHKIETKPKAQPVVKTKKAKVSSKPTTAVERLKKKQATAVKNDPKMNRSQNQMPLTKGEKKAYVKEEKEYKDSVKQRAKKQDARKKAEQAKQKKKDAEYNKTHTRIKDQKDERLFRKARSEAIRKAKKEGRTGWNLSDQEAAYKRLETEQKKKQKARAKTVNNIKKELNPANMVNRAVENVKKVNQEQADLQKKVNSKKKRKKK